MSNELAGGWIYVLMTSSDYNRFKVGRTIGNPLDRAKRLRTGDPGIALEAAYFVPNSHGKLSQMEAAVHREFPGRITFHDETISEWFPGSAQWACEWIESVFADSLSSMYMFGQDRICRAYEADLLDFYGPLRIRPIGPINLPM